MCLCGDYMCPSCGPAQGYDPAFEKFFENTFLVSPEAEEICARFDDPDGEECSEALREAAQGAYSAPEYSDSMEDGDYYDNLYNELESAKHYAELEKAGNIR